MTVAKAQQPAHNGVYTEQGIWNDRNWYQHASGACIFYNAAKMVGYSPPRQIPKKLYLVESPTMMTSLLSAVSGAVTVVKEVAM